MRLVLDTNVLLSALAFPGGKPDEVLRLVRRGEVGLFLSPFILEELERILLDKLRFTRREAEERTAAVRRVAHLVDPRVRFYVVKGKDDDNRILECAVAAEADYLVTGDKAHLLPLGSIQGIPIVTPATLLERLQWDVAGGSPDRAR